MPPVLHKMARVGGEMAADGQDGFAVLQRDDAAGRHVMDVALAIDPDLVGARTVGAAMHPFRSIPWRLD